MAARNPRGLRYGRLAAVVVAAAVTVTAVTAGARLPAAPPDPDDPVDRLVRPVSQVLGAGTDPAADRRPRTAAPRTGLPDREKHDLRALAQARELPADSGQGRRVVFSESEQRVWLVGGSGSVLGTWLVSGSLTDNLDPGTYQVWSRSEQAWGIDDSGTMRFFVRFAHGENAAIGFHDIPIDDGAKVQTADQLGTPQSHGCIRQRRPDAIRMWRFAQMGTTVVVTA